MKTAAQYLDDLKTATGTTSDYALGKHLGLSKQTVSRYRNNLDHFGPETALLVASTLCVPVENVMLDAALCRARTEEERSAWQRVIERLGGVAATVAAVAVLSGTTPPASAAADIDLASTGQPVFIMSSWRER